MPIAIRDPEKFNTKNINWARYVQLDWKRRAEYLGMPHRRPDSDPVVMDLETFEIAAEQPHIFRLSRLGVEASRRGLGPEFAATVAALIFGGTSGWNEGAHMANAASNVGLSLEEMEAEIEEGDHDAEIEANHTALEKAGHWGVPTFVFRGEPFFGQDRVDTLRWRLEKIGVPRKT